MAKSLLVAHGRLFRPFRLQQPPVNPAARLHPVGLLAALAQRIGARHLVLQTLRLAALLPWVMPRVVQMS